jgi:hypothetical protein
MTDSRLEVQRIITASPAAIFAVLCDPQGHVASLSRPVAERSGWLAWDRLGNPSVGCGQIIGEPPSNWSRFRILSNAE